jgi:hypothetical protein
VRRITSGDRREFWTVAIGAVAATASALVGVVLDLPKTLQGFVGDPLTWSVVITVTVPIIIMLAANQVAQTLKATFQREQTLADIVKLFPHSAAIVHFNSSAEAMKYLIDAVGRADKIYNTRLAVRAIEESDPHNARLTAAFDMAVQRALREGMDYFWIVSEEFADEADALKDKRNSLSSTLSTVGSYSAHVLAKPAIPFFHFCVVDYGGERELLLGWALSDIRDYSERVFLIRDNRFVDYFLNLFFMYSRAGRSV